MIQTKADVTDEQIQAIQQVVGNEYIVKDKREQRTTEHTSLSFPVFMDS